MNHSEGHLTLPANSVAAGAKLYHQSWTPDQPPKAHIILVHGYAEHGARYAYFANHCVAKGFAVHAIDHWGHGKSDGEPGFVPDFSVYHDGVTALIAAIAETGVQAPLVIVGHSLGGLISASYLLDHEQQFAACVLSGPAIKAADEPSAALKAISGLLSRLTPKMGVLALDANGISRDPAVVADYLADPLVYKGKIGARLATEMMHTMEAVQARAGSITIPLLLMHGGNDSLTAPEGSEFLNEHAGSSTKTLKIYPELFHEIFNEPEKDSVLNDMSDWVAGRLPR